MVIFESTLSSRAFGHRLGADVLAGLGRAIPYILGIYLVLKLGDLVVSKQLGLLVSDSPHTTSNRRLPVVAA